MAWYDKAINKLLPNAYVQKRISEAVMTAVNQAQYDALSNNPQHSLLLEAIKRNLKYRGFDSDNMDSLMAYSALYTKVASSRSKLITSVEMVRNSYICDMIVTQLVEDALSPETGTNHILRVHSDNPDFQKEIDWLDEKYDFDQLAATMAPEICFYGDYTLSTKVNKKPDNVNPNDGESKSNQEAYGLVGLRDDVDQAKVVAVTKWGKIDGYLVIAPEDGQMSRKKPADYVKFSLGAERVRIDMKNELNAFGITYTGRTSDDKEDIPKYIRVGKSVVFPIIGKIKELELLEAMVPASKLNKLAQGTVVGVKVPSGYGIEQAMEAVKTVEQVINKKVGVDSQRGEITVESIMSTAGRYKVIPQFGDDKGAISKMDFKSDEPEQLLSAIQDIRKVICQSCGIPFELLFGDDAGSGKGAILKKYARYLRRLKAIQRAIEEGIRQIIYIHLVNKGKKVKESDIHCEFTQKIIDTDILDRLEFSDATISILEKITDFVLKLSKEDVFKDRVRTVELMKFVNEQFNAVGFTNIINMPVDKDKDGIPDDSGVKKKFVPWKSKMRTVGGNRI